MPASTGSTLEPPALPSGVIDLQAPPPLPEDRGGGNALMNLFPMVGALGSIVLVVTGGGDRTRALLAGGMFLMATVGFLLVQVDRGRRQRTAAEDDARTDYLHYLGEVRARVRDAAAAQRQAMLWHFPEPTALPILARAGRRERGPDHEHHLHVRFGLTSWPLAVELRPPEGAPVERADPVSASALHRLLRTHRLQPRLPATVDLARFDRLELCGPVAVTTSTARAVMLSAATFHRPEELVVAVLTEDSGRWDWVKWLPHARSARRHDALGGARMVGSDIADVLAMLPSDPTAEGAHVLLVLDQVDPDLPPHVTGGGFTVLHLRSRWDQLLSPTWLRLLVDPPRGAITDRPAARAVLTGHDPTPVELDDCPTAIAVATARHLWSDASGPDAAATTTDLGLLLGLGELASLPPRSPRRPGERALLRVPIGVDEAGRTLWLDLKESAREGMGPHGLVVGATGSGKSEFLRTLVLGLALTHPPDVLNLVLVDFKGGATFAGLGMLPHCSALITNLADESTLVSRMQDALGGELMRRQEVLRSAGHLTSQREYEAVRATRDELPALPTLVVVVDEFSELLSAHPEFVDLFVAIGRLGRSLGIHLVLASQRIDEGRLRGLESHLSYRIALRTFSAAESRAVLGVPDAHDLPNRPGVGLLRTDTTSLVQFSAAYVSGPLHGARTPGPAPATVLPLTLAPVPDPATTQPSPSVEPQAAAPTPEAETVLDRAVTRLVALGGTPAHRIWLPPLDAPPTLGSLIPDVVTSPAWGLHSPRLRASPLRVPIGVVDRPRAQRRDPWVLDLSGAAGHVAVVGAPRTGRSTVLRSLVSTLALGHTPTEAQFYLLDLTGSLSALAEHPHVAGVGTRSDPDVVRRIVAEVAALVARREAWFRAHRVESVAAYRELVARGESDGHGEVFLVVDGWSTLRAEFEDLEVTVQQIATEGLSFGVHLLASAGRWTDFRTALRDLMGSRVELRLGDPLDSEVDRRSAATVPADRPGRGLTPEGEHVLSSLPTLGSTPEGPGVTHVVAAAAAAWAGPSGPKLAVLPARVERRDLIDAEGIPGCVRGGDRGPVVGLSESSMAPFLWDLAQGPHLMVFGDSGSGKSNALRTLLAEIVRTRTPQEAQIVVLDPRRALLGEVGAEHLAEYATTHGDALAVAGAIAGTLQQRMPGLEVTPEQLRNRSWWSGPEVFVVVDDHDLLSGSQGSPLEPLIPLMPHAQDVGLHVVVARRTRGASRAFFEPVAQTLRDLGTPGLVLPGPTDEGVLVGHTKARPGVPGRAQWVGRDDAQTVQVAWTEPHS